jgi:NADH-quinone oxidoreductase subunit H
MAPWPISLLPWANTGYWTMLWFFIKVLAFMFVFVWLRGTLPRIRYDQFMAIGWKVLIPVSLVWIVLVGSVRVLRNAEGFTTTQVLLWVGIPLAVVIVAAIAWPPSKKNELVVDLPESDVGAVEPEEPVSGTAGGTVVPEARGAYPVPPLDLVVPVPPIRSRTAAAPATPALTPAGAGHDLPGGSNSGGRNVVH